ncbi:cache domain-containing protein [Loa loa]|uniref:Cache domain-containing protein n=1 Tax=Loa loa TaxID=7209 RepID=A0A1I7VFQ4_LOALO|nr:cache domain-containing protein [Loa loa]EJD73910.1 cache domain-containing protein [Loa loa]
MLSQMTINWLRIPLQLMLLLQLHCGSPAEKLTFDVQKWANLLSDHLQEMFSDATREADIIAMYKNYGEVEIFDPRKELKRAKNAVEAYLKRRAKVAWEAKVSLESRNLANLTEHDVNDPTSSHFIRFMAAKQETDAGRVYVHDHTANVIEVNSTRRFNLTPNANLYGIPTSSLSSAVHVPTPVYDRNPDVLLKIDWSDIDHLYRANQEETRDLAFQMFCSESGFMRYYPAVSWVWDNRAEKLDLFDCRSTEWYINAATLSKNVIIMLDMSGSMLGQRFEIAKQTVEAILETLSDNDFFNILFFSKTVGFLDECSEKAGLLQATIRNKKMLRARLNGMSSEGKAEYEKGLIKAFETLMKLPGSVNFTTTEELALRRELAGGTLPSDVHYIAVQDHILVVPNHLYQAMHNYTGKKAQFGCNDIIMLITDGAPNYFKQIFQLYNKNKSVRFFSFLIGEEATDVAQVKWMACQNKGFMVHISNMADVQEKVQHYIKVMSRPVGKHGANFGEKDAIWSGIYKERLLTINQSPVKKKSRIKRVDPRTEMLVTTVSYPVIQDEELMGVAAVSVPVTELAQLVHTINFGSRSYAFMLDNNGYVMFHPQMRPLDPETKQMKLNYNNIDILELEVPQNQQIMRSSMINCDNGKAYTLDILYATANLERVYRQSNKYYSECLKQSLFTIGLAVANGDEKRIKPKKEMNYGDVKLLWYDMPNWLMHPTWRYCLLSDHDAQLTPEAAFREYVRKMREDGRLPKHCEYRKPLIDRFLFDMKATNDLTNLWDINWKDNKKKQIHLVWFATASGMIKYWDELPDGLTNINPNLPPTMTSETASVQKPTTATMGSQAIPKQQISYQHFIRDLNRRSSEDQYFQRSVRMPGRLVVDVNRETYLWYEKETQSTYGRPENVSLLLTVTKALEIDNALVGVVGLELTLDYMAKVMRKFGCGPQDERRWCFLLDEHAYIVYSSLNTSMSSSSGFPVYEAGIPKNFDLLGRWFGSVNRITERTMTLLLKNNYYTETTYVDYQAVCKENEVVMYTAGAAFRVNAIFGSLLRVWSRLLALLQNFAIIQILTSLIHPSVDAYTATFTGDSDTFSCDKAARYYLANWGIENWSDNGSKREMPKSSALIADNLADRPCKHNPAKCAVKMYAHWVPNTNLLLVIIVQSNPASSFSVCYDETRCPLSMPPEFMTTFSQVDNASDKQQISVSTNVVDSFSEDIGDRKCRHVYAKQRKSPSKCVHSDEDESQYPCSQKASRLVPFGARITLLVAVICRITYSIL